MSLHIVIAALKGNGNFRRLTGFSSVDFASETESLRLVCELNGCTFLIKV